MEMYQKKEYFESVFENHKKLTKSRERDLRSERQEVVYSVDWLTLNIKLHDINNPSIKNDKIYYEERERGTNVFKRIRDYYNERDELLFTIVFLPHSSIIKNDFAQLQIANKWLYVGNLKKLVHTIFFQSNFELVNISRIDLCADMFYFKNNLKPKCFIQSVASGEYTKTNPSKVVFWGKTGSQDKVTGWSEINYHCLNIGQADSTFNFKLYNKSKELEEKKEKSYIPFKWKLKLANYEELMKDNIRLKEMKMELNEVWRLEVSIKDWNKIKIGDKKVIEINNNVYDILETYPYFMQFFISKKFIWKDTNNKFIDFIDNPINDLEGIHLCTNIPNNDTVNTTDKQKRQILKSIISIIEQSITYEKANEYLIRLEELIQEEDYYSMLNKLGLNYNTLSSYIAYKFNEKPIH